MDKILVIDDSSVQAESLKSILRERYNVTVCQTAHSGLNAALTGEYSLILLDVIMPDMDGFTVLQKLKDAEVTKYIPVILITGLTNVQSEEKGLTMGAVDYICKPFSPIIIKARVNTHINLYRYQAQFREQAMLDSLTGVASRRSYNDNSIRRWREAIRLGLNFSVCMMDIDQFKLYNDTYGHPAGDRVIAAVAKEAASLLQRSTDFFARYGGEEFVAIVIGDPAEKVYEHIKLLRQTVERLHIPANSTVSDWVTVSAGGVTVSPKEGDEYETCLKIADTMLYDAKRFGRNQVVWCDQGKTQWRERKL